MAPSRGAQPNHRGPVHVVRYAKGSAKYVLSGGQDRTVRLWNPDSGAEIKVFEAHGYEVLSISVSHDNAKSVFVWDVATGVTNLHAVEFNTDASVLASGSYDATVRLWDIRSQGRAPIQVLEEARDAVQALCVDSTTIIAGSVDGYVRTYDLRKGELRADFNPSPPSLQSADATTLLVATLDSHVRLFDTATGKLLNDFTGHSHASYRCRASFGHEEATVVCGDEDGRVWGWDLVDAGHTSSRILLQRSTIKVITWTEHHPSEAGEMLTASADGTVKVWRNS
ncbi:WD40-repeat-containing domain protein [Melanogaster broomeanus]|nr:WD40-repeat-containing domain protein [Melanogaster broomeanus]